MSVTVRRLGDAAVVVTVASELSEEANDRVLALAASLRDHPLEGARVRDLVPALTSLTLHHDPAGMRGAILDQLRERAHAVMERRAASGPEVPPAPHEIPVAYGGDAGPDLREVAAFAGCTAAEVIARHTSRVYRVYMLGFLPGFAYLGDVDPAIAAPRRATPRQAVPAGSVGIAGAQTGVYPQVSPGGWQIIGRTGVRMFDPASGSRLQPGDRVRFVATSVS